MADKNRLGSSPWAGPECKVNGSIIIIINNTTTITTTVGVLPVILTSSISIL